jgi:hypothetical protein
MIGTARTVLTVVRGGLVLARRWLVAALALAAVTSAGCASAADVASTNRSDRVAEQGSSPDTSGATKEAQSPGPSPTTSTPTPTTPTKTSSSTSPSGPPRRAPRQLQNVVGAIPNFLTPSRNIGCAISGGGVRCDINQHVYRQPRKPADCSGAYGQSIGVATTGVASFLCVTDTVINRRAPILGYGSSSVVGDFGCTSRQTGIRCYYLPSKHGFWLSQERPVLF